MKKNTLQKLIDQREWVEEGMPKLLEMIQDSWSYFDALVCLACYQPLSCHQYSWALGYALSTMWVLNVNARNGCIERLTMKDFHDIGTTNFHLASKFKTSSKYQYQIVTTTDIIGVYVKYIRKHVINSEHDSIESVLFPSFKGTPMCQGEGSKKVSNIFKRYGYKLNITTLRAMMATHIEEKYHQEEISFDEYKMFVENGQTHSVSTHKKYYVKKRKHQEGEAIQQIFKKVFPQAPELATINDYYEDINPTLDTSHSQVQEEELQQLDIQPIAVWSPIPHMTSTSSSSSSSSSSKRTPDCRQFGTARSDINEMNKKKFNWTDEEISSLQQYIKDVEPSMNLGTKNRYASCLTYLKQWASDDVIKYFHPHHLVNSDRLKTGFLRALETLRVEEASKF